MNSITKMASRHFLRKPAFSRCSRMSFSPQTAPNLLQLPEACLQHVLQYCADDLCSLFSAARTNSRLHQAAVVAFSRVRVVLTERKQVKGVLQYLSNHGKDVSSIDLSSSTKGAVSFRRLPHDKLQGLSSLSFSKVKLQLNPHKGVDSVLGSGACLKQLQLHYCELLEKGKGLAKALAAALSARPELQHLSIIMKPSATCFKSSVLLGLQQLTYLELAGIGLSSRDAMRHMHALTRLQELRLERFHGSAVVQAIVLTGLQRLSVLKLGRSCDGRFGQGVLAGRPRLQRLEVLFDTDRLGWATGIAEFMSHLQHLQQLTYLDLSGRLHHTTPRDPCPPVAYSALTASSKLQHLNISDCKLPAGVWQHIFRAGEQLPHLQTLLINHVRHFDLDPVKAAAAPEASCLVSCRPGLRSLSMEYLVCRAGLLAPLTGLSSLQQLTLCPADSSAEVMEVVCQLTGLRQLNLRNAGHDDRLLLQLTQLKQLAHLCYSSGYHDKRTYNVAHGGAPVWRQVLRRLLNHDESELAQLAAAALAE